MQRRRLRRVDFEGIFRRRSLMRERYVCMDISIDQADCVTPPQTKRRPFMQRATGRAAKVKSTVP
jgi:hypothetical protein